MIEFKNNGKFSLKQAIKHFAPQIGELQLRNLLKNGDIKVNEIRVKNNIDLIGGEIIKVYANLVNQIDIKIIYQDENILICNKPKGLATIGYDGETTLESLLKKQYNEIYAVQRLDTNTDGLIIFAKNIEAKGELDKVIRDKKVEKFYRTTVYSKRQLSAERCEDYLLKDEKNGIVKTTSRGNGQLAILEYSLISEFGNDLYELEVQLFTGRTHQIRVQLSSREIYIIGDGKYGDKEINKIYKNKKMCLTSYKVKFLINNGKLKYLYGKEFINVFYNGV